MKEKKRRKGNEIHQIMQDHIQIMHAANTVLALKYNIRNTLHYTLPNAKLSHEPILLLATGIRTASPTIFLPPNVVTNRFIPNGYMVCINTMGISETSNMNLPTRSHHWLLLCPHPTPHFYHFPLPIFWKFLPKNC